MPGNYNNLKNLQMAQALSRGSGFTPAQQRGEESYNTPPRQMNPAYNALNEAMGAPGMANPFSAGGPTSRPPNQSPWSGGQMERLRRLEPQEIKQLQQMQAGQSAPAASPQEMLQQQPSRFKMHGDNWREFTGQPNGNPFSTPTDEEMNRYKGNQEQFLNKLKQPFEAPASGFTKKMLDNHPLTLLKNLIMGK